MRLSSFIFGLFAALFGGMLLGFMISPIKNGVNFNNSKFMIGSNNTKNVNKNSRLFCVNNGENNIKEKKDEE